MKVTVSNIFSKSNLILKDPKEKGIPRLKEIEIINQSKTDIKYFRPLYDAYFQLILNYVNQKVDNRDLAFDITSQAFLKAMLNIKSYSIREVPFVAWLYKIAFNETMHFFRKSKNMRVIVLDDSLIDGINTELEEFPREKILKSIESMIKNLKAEDFELIELRFYQGKSFLEIGYILGCSENTAKVRSHRLIRRLRQELLKKKQHETI